MAATVEDSCLPVSPGAPRPWVRGVLWVTQEALWTRVDSLQDSEPVALCWGAVLPHVPKAAWDSCPGGTIRLAQGQGQGCDISLCQAPTAMTVPWPPLDTAAQAHHTAGKWRWGHLGAPAAGVWS